MKKLSQKRLADTILNGRKQKGLTQQKLAELTGINRTMLSHMETEEYMPSIPQLEALASVLEFDPGDLFEEASSAQSIRPDPSLRIAVAGTGYVGLSIAVLLSQHHKVTAVDIVQEKVDQINQRISPIQDEYIEK